MILSHNVLELNQILETISEKVFSQTAKEIILETKPSSDFKLVVSLLEQVNETVSLIHRFGHFPFVERFDIVSTAKQLGFSTSLSIESFISIRRFIKMQKAFESYQSQMNSSYEHIFEYLKALKPTEIILKEINLVISDDGQIYDNVTSTLNEIRRSIKTKHRILEKLLAEVLTKYSSYLNESLIVMRNGRYAIPIKESFKNKVKGVIHDISASKQTVYIEPDDIRQVTQDLEYLQQLESAEILKILTELTTKLKPQSEVLVSHIEAFINLDVIHAKAIYSVMIKAIMPSINFNGIIDMRKARHPLIDPLKVVPIDVILNNETKILMITGPNTGGKTVALKTIGLLTIMLQSGLLVPLNEGSQMSLFHSVFADIGDEQSIAQSLSTFSSHLTKIKSMFDQMSSSALILLDELGSGTDPIEGVALAISIIEELRHKKDIRLILTTHYSELKLYAYEHSDILTASVAFDLETLKPLYRLQLGISGSSHAISIAERLGLQKSIIDRAKILLSGRQTNIAKSIEKLSNEQNKLEIFKEEMALKEKELNRQIQSYKDKQKQFDLEKNEILEKIKVKEQKKYEKLKAEALELIDELSKKESLSVPEKASFKGKINAKPVTQNKKNNEEINLNDSVYIHTYQQEGIVTDIKKDKITVALGQFELSFNKSEVSKIDSLPKVEKKIIKSSMGTTPVKGGSIELDLRGVRYEEVKELMDKAIDDAILGNIPFLRVIHGFGTGAIRKAVHAYIKTSPYIKSHRYGGAGEGLNGVTIINF